MNRRELFKTVVAGTFVATASTPDEPAVCVRATHACCPACLCEIPVPVGHLVLIEMVTVTCRFCSTRVKVRFFEEVR